MSALKNGSVFVACRGTGGGLLSLRASTMRPQSCKSKGRRLQQRVVKSIMEAFPELGDGDAVSTSMGAGGEDVRMSPAARQCVPLSIECKNVEKINIWACLEQTTANTPTDASPCLVFTRNRSPVWAVVPWDVLLALYRRARHGPVATTPHTLPPHLERLLLELSAFVRHPSLELEDATSPSPGGGGASSASPRAPGAFSDEQFVV